MKSLRNGRDLALLSLFAVFFASGLEAQQAPAPARAAVTGSTPYHFHHVRIGAGGFITGVLFHPTVSGLAYVRTDIGGAYRWDGAERRWTSLSEWLPASESNLIGVESMAVDPLHPNDLYLAAGTYTHPGVPNGALLRSHDRGAHFEIIPLPFQLGGNEPGRFAGERLALDPAHPGVMYLGTRNNGLWRSTDHGTTWATVQRFPGKSTNGIGVVFVLFGPKGTDGAGANEQPVYAGVSTANGPNLYLSNDAGEHWRPLAGAPTGMLPYHAVFTADGTLFVTYGNAPGPNDVTNGAVWKRTARGEWQQITPEPPAGNSRGFGYAGLAIDPHHPGTVLVSTLDRWQPGDTIFASRDSGQHWTSLTDQAVRDASASPYLVHGGKLPFGHWVGAVAIDPFDPNHVFYGTGETLWTTYDLEQAWANRPTHWTVGAEGIEETAVISLLAPPAGAPLFPGLGDIGCFRADSVAAGKEATALEPPSLSNCDAIAVAAQRPRMLAMAGRVWSGNSHGGLSIDGGHTWRPFAAEPAGSAGGGSIAMTAGGETLFWTTGAGSFASKDQGAHWSLVASCNGGERERAQIVADPRDARRIYVLSPRTGTLLAVTLHGTSAGEASTAVMDSPRSTTSCALPNLGVSKVLRSNLPKGTRYLSDPELGSLWVFGPQGVSAVDPVTGAMRPVANNARVSAFAVGKPLRSGGPETLFLAGQLHGEDGIYRSTDGGATWRHIDDAQHRYGYISPMAADPRVAGRVYLGTNGLGVIVGEPASAPQ